MIYFLWILGILLFAMGSFVTVLNWGAFWKGIKGERGSSLIPLLGGLLLSASFAVVPIPFCRQWWWVGLLLDWGSLPSIAYSFLWAVSQKLRGC